MTTPDKQPIKHAIRNRWTDAVLFECDVPEGLERGLRTRYVLEKAAQAGANLADAYLAGAYLAGANFAGANFVAANFAGANFAGANFVAANFAGANFAGANFAGANLAGAYLAYANLVGANLVDAYFAGANFAGANLAGAKWRDGIVINKPPIQITGLHWFVTILDAHMQIGCELHSLAEWESFDDARIVAMDGRDALRFWRAHKDALLAMARGAGRSFEAAAVAEVA